MMKRFVVLFFLTFGIVCTIAAKYERTFLGTVSWTGSTEWSDCAVRFNDSYILAKLSERANQQFPGYANKSVNIINNQVDLKEKGQGDDMKFRFTHYATGEVWYDKWVDEPKPEPVKVVEISNNSKTTPTKLKLDKAVCKAIEKATEGISSGARIAINLIRVPDNVQKNEIKDIILDFLLDSNYKVVAKEHLETLKSELEEQNSGNYNTQKRAENDNFSGAGYLIDCKIASNLVRIYLVNVSTGEYAGTSKMEYID